MSVVRREATPSAVLHFQELRLELHGGETRLVVRCSACRWEEWTAMPVWLSDIALVAQRCVVHGKSVCILNRCN